MKYAAASIVHRGRFQRKIFSVFGRHLLCEQKHARKKKAYLESIDDTVANLGRANVEQLATHFDESGHFVFGAVLLRVGP